MKKFTAIILSVILVLSFCTVAYADNSVTVTLDGNSIKSDVAPQIVDGRTMVPLRAIFEALGATVAWSESTRTVTAIKDNDVVICTIDSYKMTVNGEQKKLDVAPMIIDGRTMVPVRFVAEAFGCNVGWDGEKRIVSIITKKSCYPGTNIISFTSVTKLPSKDVYTDKAGFVYNEYDITTLKSISDYIDALTADGWTVVGHNESGGVMIERYKKGKACVDIWLTVDAGNVDPRIAIGYNEDFYKE